MPEDLDVKATLNLPQTSFDMKANLVAKEPLIQKRWQEQKLYARIKAARELGDLSENADYDAAREQQELAALNEAWVKL